MATKSTKAPARVETICVRIKRYNPKRGHRMQRFGIWGLKFLEEVNWYKVPAQITYLDKRYDLKSYLEDVHQDNDDPESPFAFDVVTVAEMERINKKERKAEEDKQFNLRRVGEPVDMTRRRRSDEDESGDLTTDDLPVNQGRRKFPRSVRPATRQESLAEE